MQKSIKEYLMEKIGKPVKLEHPAREEMGDFAVFGDIDLKPDEIINRTEKVGGFTNIWLQNEWLINQLDGVIKEFPQNNKTVVVEYSSPNIAKPFGIGHLRSTIIGQALYNMYKFLGWKVIGDNHLGDWGTQFGKLLYMIDLRGEKEIGIEKLEALYVEFHALVKSEPELEEKAREWFVRLEKGEPEVKKVWEECVRVSMFEFDRVYKLLKVKIDNAYGESFYETLMRSVVDEAKTKGIATRSDGAWVIEIPNEKTPLMLLKSDEATTYATRDLATLKFRRDTWSPDMIIYEVGAEQTLHFRQVFGAAERLGYVDSKTKLVHTKHGLYLSPDGKKFSTRGGKTVNLEAVLKEAIERARKLGNKECAEEVGIGAVKYFDLLHNVQSDIVFDWEKIMALEGNSGPYLQYTHARTKSVLAKSQSPNSKMQTSSEYNAEELAILRCIYRFPEVVEEAAERCAPNLVCNFLFELAQRFNGFYSRHLILGSIFRLKLTLSVGGVLKTGLGLLGIESPSKM